MKKIFGIVAALAVATIIFAGSQSQAEAGGGVITVSSPSGGVYAIGESVAVSWSVAEGYTFYKINLILERHGRYAGNQITELRGDSSGVTWSPRDYLRRADLGLGGGYKLKVCGFLDSDLQEMHCGYSNEFAVTNELVQRNVCEGTPFVHTSWIARDIAAQDSRFGYLPGYLGCDNLTVVLSGWSVQGVQRQQTMTHDGVERKLAFKLEDGSAVGIYVQVHLLPVADKAVEKMLWYDLYAQRDVAYTATFQHANYRQDPDTKTWTYDIYLQFEGLLGDGHQVPIK